MENILIKIEFLRNKYYEANKKFPNTIVMNELYKEILVFNHARLLGMKIEEARELTKVMDMEIITVEDDVLNVYYKRGF